MWFLHEMQILRAPFQESQPKVSLAREVMSNTLMADSLDCASMFDLLCKIFV